MKSREHSGPCGKIIDAIESTIMHLKEKTEQDNRDLLEAMHARFEDRPREFEEKFAATDQSS